MGHTVVNSSNSPAECRAVVLGFEGDADWTDINGSSSSAYCTAVGATCVTKNSVLATARARVGYEVPIASSSMPPAAAPSVMS